MEVGDLVIFTSSTAHMRKNDKTFTHLSKGDVGIVAYHDEYDGPYSHAVHVLVNGTIVCINELDLILKQSLTEALG